MRRITTLLALVAVCSLGISAAQACPKSCDKKASAKQIKLTKSACSAKQACASADKFPTLVQLVGDKKVGCPVEAEKLAKANGDKIIYVVGSKRFECRQAAATAWAEASESYAKRFLTIACVVDGKVIYCDQPCSDVSACSSAKAKLSKADAKDCYTACAAKAKLASADGKTCSKAAKAKLAKADGKGCCSASKAKLAKAEGKSSCSASKAKLAKADGKGCCSASKAKLAKTDGKDCSKTCPFAEAKLAKTDGKTCPHPVPLTKLASADGKTCSEVSKAKLAKADGKGCCSKAAKAKLAKAEGKGSCSASKARLAKADGKGCCSASKAKLAKTDGKGSCKASAKRTKIVSAEGKGCCKAAKTSLAKAHGDSFSAQGKTVKYRVVGRSFDTWAAAAKARDQATVAAKTVSMKYIVDGKEVNCSSQVCPKAKAAGKVVYVVSGEKMECQFKARVALAKAKCQAAKKACTELLAKM